VIVRQDGLDYGKRWFFEIENHEKYGNYALADRRHRGIISEFGVGGIPTGYRSRRPRPARAGFYLFV